MRFAYPRMTSVGLVMPFLNVLLRLGQSVVHRVRVPITVSKVEAHPERRADAVHEAHDHTQHRLQQRLDER